MNDTDIETLDAAAEQIEQHPQVDSIVRCWEDDTHACDALMVRLDWVTESHREGNTRIIDDKNYDGHIRNVSDFIDSLADVHVARQMDSGLYGCTMFVEAGEKRVFA